MSENEIQDGIEHDLSLNVGSVYKGWHIWHWTGWKGEKTTALCETKHPCVVCDKSFREGDVLWVNQGSMPRHWSCQYPDNRLDTLCAQWCATDKPHETNPNKRRYIEANCGLVDELEIHKLPAQEYKRGDAFEIPHEFMRLKEDASDEDKERAKRYGLARLKMLIDELEG